LNLYNVSTCHFSLFAGIQEFTMLMYPYYQFSSYENGESNRLSKFPHALGAQTPKREQEMLQGRENLNLL
jgi:hypothetical protein